MTQVTPWKARQPIPWYFKFMLLATIVYLGWRIFQLISWASHHF